MYVIPSNLCYMPPSVEYLRPTTLIVVKPGSMTHPVFKPDWRPCIKPLKIFYCYASDYR